MSIQFIVGVGTPKRTARKNISPIQTAAYAVPLQKGETEGIFVPQASHILQLVNVGSVASDSPIDSFNWSRQSMPVGYVACGHISHKVDTAVSPC